MESILFTVDPEKFKNDIVNLIEQRINALKNQSNTNEHKLMSRKETTDYLGIALSTLWKYTKDGTLKAYYIGNRVYYKLEEIDKALIKIS